MPKEDLVLYKLETIQKSKIFSATFHLALTTIHQKWEIVFYSS